MIPGIRTDSLSARLAISSAAFDGPLPLSISFHNSVMDRSLRFPVLITRLPSLQIRMDTMPSGLDPGVEVNPPPKDEQQILFKKGEARACLFGKQCLDSHAT